MELLLVLYLRIIGLQWNNVATDIIIYKDAYRKLNHETKIINIAVLWTLYLTI